MLWHLNVVEIEHGPSRAFCGFDEVFFGPLDSVTASANRETPDQNMAVVGTAKLDQRCQVANTANGDGGDRVVKRVLEVLLLDQLVFVKEEALVYRVIQGCQDSDLVIASVCA
ncbi:hypothetical protein [Ralstonia sp. SET104]|uniref:hypothetical protein n=1 Tax=Ralstonia sp. SET104 TaxID=2448774 RepID=UPI000F56F21E|nr:hypothetical protein [Ralstonia sp. SET104]GCB02604.1 hypothetical protein PSUB009319_02350 [Ralstonia sp. SET104]